MRARSLPILLLALLLVGGAVALGLDGGAMAPDDVVGRAEDEKPEDVVEAASLTAGADETAEAASGGDAAPEERAAVVLDLPGDDGPRLRVVEAGTRRPVPFAEVFVGEGDLEWRARRDESVSHWATLLERDAKPRRADAQGEVSLPPVRRRLMVAGRSARLFGAMHVNEGEATPVLELRPDATLRARVRGTRGEPVPDVRVVLAADFGVRVQPLAVARTDPEGIAVLPHVQLFETRVPPPEPDAVQWREQRNQEVRARLGMIEAFRAQAAANSEAAAQLRAAEVALRDQVRMWEAQAREAQRSMPATPTQPEAQPLADFVLVAAVPLQQPVFTAVPVANVPGEIVELRLPATGTVAARIVGPDDRDLLTPCRITLRVADRNRLGDGRLRSIDQLCVARGEKQLGVEPALVGPIGLGLRLHAAVNFADDDFDFEQGDVVGPVAETPQPVSLRAPGWFSVIVGRLVDGAGAPIPDLAAELFVAGVRGRVEGERVRADASGRFELPVRLRQEAPPYTLEVAARRGEQRIGKLVSVPTLVPGGRTELGDVPLATLAVLAAGNVRDDLGRPIAGADVVVEVRRRDDWTEESFVRAGTDAEGAFTLFGDARNVPTRVRARARGHAVAFADVAVGARVELVLSRLGSIRVSGFLPAFLPTESFSARVVEVATGNGRDLRVRRRGEDSFELRADDLTPGQWDLSLRIHGLPRPLAFAQRILVPPGERVRPADIDGLDLRHRLFRYRITAVDQAGQPMRDPGSPLLVQMHDERGIPQWVPFPWRGAQIDFVADQPSVPVVGLSNGHAAVRTLVQTGEAQLTFRRVHPVSLTLPGVRGVLGPEQAARISLVLEDDSGLPAEDLQAIDQRSGRSRGYPRAALGKSSGGGLGGNDEVTMGLIFNGTYEVVLRIDGPGGRVSKTIAKVAVVVDGPEPPKLVVAPDLGAVRAALAELRARPPADRSRRGR